jgi:AmmeMemoRadiSam system protein B
MATRVRQPAVAGTFYPDDPETLRAQVDAFVHDAPYRGATPKAIVVPHAGYVYSGPTAATAYARLLGDERRRVLLVGPSHFTWLAGLAACSAQVWRTPLGDVPADPLPYDVAVADAAHDREHSLEVQLPFLQRAVGPDLRVVPVGVGAGDPDAAADLLEELWADREVLVVCSTDLSHYHDLATARRLDRRTAEAIVARDVRAIATDDACGVHAVHAVLTLARRHGDDVELLDLRTSGDTAGDPASVVGYGAFAVGAVEPGRTFHAGRGR